MTSVWTFTSGFVRLLHSSLAWIECLADSRDSSGEVLTDVVKGIPWHPEILDEISVCEAYHGDPTTSGSDSTSTHTSAQKYQPPLHRKSLLKLGCLSAHPCYPLLKNSLASTEHQLINKNGERWLQFTTRLLWSDRLLHVTACYCCSAHVGQFRTVTSSHWNQIATLKKIMLTAKQKN